MMCIWDTMRLERSFKEAKVGELHFPGGILNQEASYFLFEALCYK